MSTLKGNVSGSMALKDMASLKEKTKKRRVVHSSAVREAGLKYLNEGDELTFEGEHRKRSFSS